MTLTREQVLAMGAGREVDALLLQRVFGINCGSKQGYDELIDENGSVVPIYSADISAAWKVVKHLSKKYGVNVYEDEGAPCECKLHKWSSEPNHEAEAETAPLAICRAALLTTLEEETP